MAELKAEGAELNRLLKQAKKQPMSFAFCPGPTDESDVLYIHRHKNPEILAKIARDESAGTKTAFGTLVVAGKTVLLTCVRELPAMEKQLRRYMKSQKLPMEVRVVEADSPNPGSNAETVALVARLGAVQSDMAAIAGDRGAKLKAALRGAVRLIRSGDLEKAESAIDIIESALTQGKETPPPDPGI